MADHSLRDIAEPQGIRLLYLARLTGAAMSLALVAGLAVWGYRLAVRDVAGVPVIKALAGPSRTAPEDPGGDMARHTGLAVNAVAAEGTAEEPADRLALAPQVAALGEDAPPMAALRPAPRVARPATPTSEAADAELPEPEVAIPANLAETLDPAADAAALAIALAEELAAGAAPLTEAPAEPLAADAAVEDAGIVAADVPGVARSPRPILRPVGSAAPEAPTAPDASGASVRSIAPEAVGAAIALALAPQPETGLREIDPDSLAIGTKLAQIGAYDDAETARREWEKAEARFGSLMQGKGRVIQETETGGRRFFRLRVEGFPEMADARRFCAALQAEGADCIATEVR